MVDPNLEFEHKLRTYVGEVRQKMIADYEAAPSLYSCHVSSLERASIRFSSGGYDDVGWYISCMSENVYGAQLHEVADELMRRFLVQSSLKELPALLSPPTVTQTPEPLGEDDATAAALDEVF